ncbi:hypothetical protein E4T56_gene10374 [Termitomyces sp. T112]|nr:hypothetical protein E4T56_gene10374 [Termitomyces sp. T112]
MSTRRNGVTSLRLSPSVCSGCILAEVISSRAPLNNEQQTLCPSDDRFVSYRFPRLSTTKYPISPVQESSNTKHYTTHYTTTHNITYYRSRVVTLPPPLSPVLWLAGGINRAHSFILSRDR